MNLEYPSFGANILVRMMRYSYTLTFPTPSPIYTLGLLVALVHYIQSAHFYTYISIS